MKKLFGILLATAALCLTGCNQDMTWGSFSFHYVHVQMYGMTEPVHFKVNSWRGDDGGIELQTEKHRAILLGDGTYMMYDQEACPICGQVEYK